MATELTFYESQASLILSSIAGGFVTLVGTATALHWSDAFHRTLPEHCREPGIGENEQDCQYSA